MLLGGGASLTYGRCSTGAAPFFCVILFLCRETNDAGKVNGGESLIGPSMDLMDETLFFFLLPFFFPYFFDGLRAGSRFPWPNREIDRLHRAQLPINGDVEVKSRGSFSKRIGATGRQLHRLSAVALLFDMQTRWMDRVSVTFAIETTP